MNEQPLAPTAPAKSTGTSGADLVAAEVLARMALGHSKRKVARDLHVGRHRIDDILSQHQAAPNSTSRVAQIIPLAYDAVERTLRTNEHPKTAHLGMRVLERTDLSDKQDNHWTIAGDVNLQQHLTLLPSLSRGNVMASAPVPATALLQEPPAAAPQLAIDAEIIESTPAEVQPAAAASSSSAAHSEAAISSRQAAVDRQCEENLRAAHEEQQRSSGATTPARYAVRRVSSVPRQPNLDW